jgi:putative membrane protein
MISRDLGIVLLVVLGAFVLLPALMMSMWGGWGMMGRWGSGAGFGFGLLVLLLFIVGIVLIVLAFIRKEPRGEEPLELLKRRLAKGEITKEQFDDLKRAL